MSHNVTPNTSRVELRKTLTLVPVVMMGLAYMQPMTLFDTFGIVSGLTDGHVPTAYAFALIAILFTALSYGKLVRRYPSAGSAYTYAQKSISPTVGFMVGWSSLLDYLFAPMINILLAKIYFEALVPSIPSWMIVVALEAFMTAYNLRSLKSVAICITVIVVLLVVLSAVILGGENSKQRFQDATKLLNYGFGKCQVYEDNDPPKLKPVEVQGGVKEQIHCEYADTFRYLATSGANLAGVTKVCQTIDNWNAAINCQVINYLML